MMLLQGQERIAAPRVQVWRALNDPAILKACIPGCESIEMVSPTEMKTRVALRLGPIKASFSGQVTLSDIDPPNGCTISGEGSGGSAGGARASVQVKLVEEAGATLLNYNVSSHVSGKIAQLGARLVDSAAQTLIGDFFARLNELAQQTLPAAAQLSPSRPMLLPRDDRTNDRANGATWPWFIAFALGTSALLAWIWFSSR